MKFSVLDIIDIITLFQLTLFIFFLVTHRKGNRLNNLLLAMFFFAQGSCILNSSVLRFYDFFYTNNPHLFYIGKSFALFWGPSIYFYTRTFTDKDFLLRKSHLFHLIPFVLHFSFIGYRFHFHSVATKLVLLDSQQILSIQEKYIESFYFQLVAMSYLMLSLINSYKYRQELKLNFSFIDKINLSWLNFFLSGFMIIWMLEFSDTIARIFIGNSIGVSRYIHLFVFVMVNFLLYKSLRQPEVLLEIEKKQKYKTSVLTEQEKERYLKILLDFMSKEKPYLIPSLTITELSEKVIIPARHISHIINESLRQNFYDFINSYRIEEAKSILINPKDNKKTVLEILYEVGFNSKTAFNVAFKKHTKMNPADFKKTFKK